MPSFLEIEQILNNLERMFQWHPQPNLFDLKRGQLLQGPYVDKFEIKLNKSLTLISLKMFRYTVIFLSLKILFKGVVLISN